MGRDHPGELAGDAVTVTTNEVTPWEIAKDTVRAFEYETTAKGMATVFITAAIEHYEQGHWAEARTAASIARAISENSYA